MDAVLFEGIIGILFVVNFTDLNNLYMLFV